MFGRKKKPPECLPWYRARDYKGDLTENEKRQLDSFRMRQEHPAASYDTLPGEVKGYISELTMEIYDRKQERLVMGCFVVSGASAFFLARYAFGYAEGSLFEYSLSLGMLIFPWIYYRIKWRKNADEYVPPGEAVFPVNEALRKNWEQAYIVNKRSAERT
jgi:hypothetical protein